MLMEVDPVAHTYNPSDLGAVAGGPAWAVMGPVSKQK